MPKGKNSELTVGLALRQAALDSNGQSLQVVIRAAEKAIGVEISNTWALESLLAEGFIIRQDTAKSVAWPPV
jgi:hypothetical protein